MLQHRCQRKHVLPAIPRLYDDIWIYGLPQICEPLEGIELPASVRQRLTYTGYLRRLSVPHPQHLDFDKISDPFILVTVGGGGDGEAIVDWVLRAYEEDPSIPYPALIVLGPFMGSELQSDFQRRVNLLDRVEAITFNAHVESLMARALGVVCMGGYNTFCEILTFDKPAILVPRRHPRAEQHIRAARAECLGLVRMLSDENGREPERMAQALRALPTQKRPSDAVIPGLLDGLDRIHDLTEHWLPKLLQQEKWHLPENKRSNHLP